VGLLGVLGSSTGLGPCLRTRALIGPTPPHPRLRSTSSTASSGPAGPAAALPGDPRALTARDPDDAPARHGYPGRGLILARRCRALGGAERALRCRAARQPGFPDATARA
jgi:hypothetical protein